MTITLSGFAGINNVANDNRLPAGYLTECVNFNIDNSGIISQRGGYVEKIAGEFTALWSDGLRCFAVKDGDLIEVLESGESSILCTGVGRVGMDFTVCDGNYYYCSVAHNGVISSAAIQTAIGQAMVERQPRITPVSGGILLAGRYLVAVTTINENGEESGTAEPVLFELLEDGKALELTDFDATTQPYYAVYVSNRNGTELFRQGIIASSTSSVIIYDVDDSTESLDSIGLDKAPYGSLIAYHYGHLFIARDNYLYYSMPMQHGRWSDENYYSYASNITAVLPCENGIWISTQKDGTYWISGKTPDQGAEAQGDFVQIKKITACLNVGSSQRVEPDFIKQVSWGWVATAKQGIYVLLDGGQFANVTFDNIKLPEYSSCAGAIIEHNDSINYLSIISGAVVPARSI